MRNAFEAQAFYLPTKNGHRTDRGLSVYPTVPADWGNRAARRAARHGKVVTAIKPLPPKLFQLLWFRLQPRPVETPST